MRLKEDRNNWRASSIIRKQAVVPEVVKAPAKKDTVKWCKGKVGREHVYELIVPPNEANLALFAGYKKLPVCANCGKQDYRGVMYRQKDGSYSPHVDWHGLHS